ncbi:MAG: guanylate kinase [Chloroflexi bacterium]|nr:guanylate kinase [Chloroflexota bacterium]MCL5108307.1 guanylate kinase [Chloroflexota bacterium]
MSEKGRSSLLIVLSGPSGVGKDAVIQRLKASAFPLHYTVTVTTRPRRPNEVHGVDYFFTGEADFDAMLARDELLESALVHGHKYGTPRQQVREALAAHKDVLLKIDVQGATQVRHKVPEAVSIFLAPANLDELVRRLRSRGSESAAELALRLHNAEGELEDLPNYDYVVLNEQDRLQETVDQVKAIITAEHCRVRQRRIVV